MHKISNFTGTARHFTGSMGFMGRSHHDMPISQPQKRSLPGAAASSPVPARGTLVTLSFNVPFNSDLTGPEPNEIIYASPGAFDRWTFPEGTADDTPVHELPVHTQNVDNLRSLCNEITESTGGNLQASIMCAEPKPIPTIQPLPLKSLVTNVCLYGETEQVQQVRGEILTRTPISLRSATVEIEEKLVFRNSAVRSDVLNHLDQISNATKADVFLLHPKQVDETASFTGALDGGPDSRLRCMIFGDMETLEHAKVRVLIMIDQILNRHVDTMNLELSMHTLISGRGKKNIKSIESMTNTAIYFPPCFPRLYGYSPRDSIRRAVDEIIITGQNVENIMQAKKKIHDLVMTTKSFIKPIIVTESKIDNILLERLDKIYKVIETNGSYVLMPSLGLQRGAVRVQGTDVLHVERTVREVMSLAGQFYSASWWIQSSDPSQRQPTPADVRAMLSDICINSGAEISFESFNFHIHGSDDAVKGALVVISNIPFVKKSQHTISVKIELANEHKEFVSGKKNGKINKIMSHSNVQIIFDGFNEYNFYIDVRGGQYEAIKNGLELVEQEMPASIAFHVPDQYHKRIIGIGGQHIQRIMKKYSVFVKFSNAMDRGGLGKEEDDIKVDNVICRTPARNAQNLDLVKQEIMDMVEKVDAEFVQEHVVINRLYHRELIARMDKIEELEKKWNCKIIFPSTEQASDVVTVSGPEYQVPQAVDEFLGMVPETHEIAFPAPDDLQTYLRSEEFPKDVIEKMKSQYVVDVHINTEKPQVAEGAETAEEKVVLSYTRNNAGGLKDAIDFLIARLVSKGLDAATVKGSIPRPKSDSFEESLPFFESKLLHRAEPAIGTDSPTRSTFGDENGEQSGFFSKFRKPGSMSSFSSLIDRRKTGTNSPNSMFKHASSNASKASLVSLESQGSGYRNPWNDSGINLPEEEHPNGHHNGYNNGISHVHNNGTWVQPTPPFHNPNSTTSKFNFGAPLTSTPGDTTPRYDPRASFDSGRPSTSHSLSGYPGPIGPPR
ncbi:hypothetical protein K402DRAFT_415966 [Aulographum hederae CBS 113979]|uniref:K Homology domain-containing protein n=1 Tax=Aulographum hederae CBS 113979 TaxID=1176131 RepID=A0A6G1HGR7_9PEZI|nr:hypothetical protein K402DRAFT_415966 [Aulographum hederae CBS 113979]